MWPGYKSSLGMPPELLAQFGLLEEALAAMGVAVWPMVDLEADDGLAAAAAAAKADPDVDQVLILTPDKDLAQCVEGRRVVQVDRRSGTITDEDGVRARYGIGPESIPDWLALVGDSADGFPGLAGWGKKTASVVLARYPHLEDIPELGFRWDIEVRGRDRLAATLAEQRELALLFRDLATLRADGKLFDGVENLRWTGPANGLGEVATRIRAWRLVDRVTKAAEARTGSR
jgi:5'-3' exonuclease